MYTSIASESTLFHTVDPTQGHKTRDVGTSVMFECIEPDSSIGFMKLCTHWPHKSFTIVSRNFGYCGWFGYSREQGNGGTSERKFHFQGGRAEKYFLAVELAYQHVHVVVTIHSH